MWVHGDVREELGALLSTADIEVETGDEPSDRAVVLVAPFGQSTVAAAEGLLLSAPWALTRSAASSPA